MGGPIMSPESVQSPFRVRFIVGSLCLFLAIVSSFLFTKQHGSSWTDVLQSYMGDSSNDHPIDALVKDANEAFLRMDKTRHLSLAEAADIYREKRGRHPPPGFDAWHEFATGKGVIIAEHFFDRIYDDLAPFWAVPPEQMRRDALSWSWVMSIRGGNHTFRYFGYGAGALWLQNWWRLIADVVPLLPDMDLAFNNNDEPTVFVPWDVVNEHMQISEKTKHTQMSWKGEPVIQKYQTLAHPAADDIPSRRNPPEFYALENDTFSLWPMMMRDTCAPDSKARQSTVPYTEPPQFEPPPHPYVQNVTHSKVICDNPHLADLNGAISAPRTIHATRRFFPIFSGCKMEGNNDILVPAASYRAIRSSISGIDEKVDGANPDPEETNTNASGQSGADYGRNAEEAKPYDQTPWEDKEEKIFWRGMASSGDGNASSWRHLHRHRFVSMMNGTQVAVTGQVLKGDLPTELDSQNFPYPDSKIWPLTALKSSANALGEWMKEYMDAGFTHLLCNPWRYTQWGKGDNCEYLNPYYYRVDGRPMPKQYKFRYLPDVDGFSYSGRYRGFLRSRSLPIKATIFFEWHDSRLVPWKHFIPMHNTYADWFGILEWLLGFKEPGKPNSALNKAGHDAEAKQMAQDGADWALEALTWEDMSVYMFRLLLEYGRVSNDDRERLGFVADLER